VPEKREVLLNKEIVVVVGAKSKGRNRDISIKQLTAWLVAK
jgi:hypothetical protein